MPANTIQSNDAYIGRWQQIISVFAAVLFILGAFLATTHPTLLASPHEPASSAVLTYAYYFASRNLAIALALLTFLWLRAKSLLSAAMFIAALTQLLDAMMDCAEKRWPILPMALILGVIFSITALQLYRNEPKRRLQD